MQTLPVNSESLMESLQNQLVSVKRHRGETCIGTCKLLRPIFRAEKVSD